MCHYLVNTNARGGGSDVSDCSHSHHRNELFGQKIHEQRWTSKPFASPAHPPAPPLPSLTRPPRWVESIRRPPPARFRARRAFRTSRSRSARARAQGPSRQATAKRPMEPPASEPPAPEPPKLVDPPAEQLVALSKPPLAGPRTKKGVSKASVKVAGPNGEVVLFAEMPLDRLRTEVQSKFNLEGVYPDRREPALRPQRPTHDLTPHGPARARVRRRASGGPVQRAEGRRARKGRTAEPFARLRYIDIAVSARTDEQD